MLRRIWAALLGRCFDLRRLWLKVLVCYPTILMGFLNYDVDFLFWFWSLSLLKSISLSFESLFSDKLFYDFIVSGYFSDCFQWWISAAKSPPDKPCLIKPRRERLEVNLIVFALSLVASVIRLFDYAAGGLSSAVVALSSSILTCSVSNSFVCSTFLDPPQQKELYLFPIWLLPKIDIILLLYRMNYFSRTAGIENGKEQPSTALCLHDRRGLIAICKSKSTKWDIEYSYKDNKSNRKHVDEGSSEWIQT